MSHHFIVPTNENGMALDQHIDTDMAVAMGPPFQFAHVFLFSHGWWTNATRAMEGYNRFTIEFWKWGRGGRPMAILVTGITAIPNGPDVQPVVIEPKPLSGVSVKS